MKKSKSGIGGLVVLAVLVYPFVWIFENFGWIGLGLVVAAIVLFVIGSSSGKGNQQEFDRQVLYFLKERFLLEEAKKVNLQLAKSNFPRAELVRNVQIINDSIDIALTSKKRDVAESRMNLALERHQEIQGKHSGLVSPEVSAEINRIVKEAEETFRTKMYVNVATGYIEKAQKLKTAKSKEKYLNMAIDTLNEGKMTGAGDASKLDTAIVKVERLKEILISS